MYAGEDPFGFGGGNRSNGISYITGDVNPLRGESHMYTFFMLLVVTLTMSFASGACRGLWAMCRTNWESGSVVRTIKGTFHREGYHHRFGENGGGSHSGILFNAVLMHICRCVDMPKRGPHFWGARAWRNKPSVLFLFDPLKSDSHLVLGARAFEPLGGYCVNAEQRAFYERKKLNRYKVARLPTAGSWMSVDGDIEVTYQRSRVDGEHLKKVEHMLHIRSTSHNADQRLDEFVQRSLQHYIMELPGSATAQRFYFQSTNDGATLRFKRSRLSANTTFETLFFPQKNDVMKLLDCFLKKEGRFAVDGFPHRIGFLVHGPQGTGKTSLAAAVASYTGRHVISLRLSSISTEQQLYDVFLSCSLACIGESELFVFDYSDVIFLLEDVDPTDALLQRRLPHAAREAPEERGAVVGGGGGSDALSFLAAKKGEKTDKLNMSALLCVLDGVVDMPSRIIMMITRDPHGIDPALLRPGRFGNQIHMDYMRRAEIIQLLGLHFGSNDVKSASVCSESRRTFYQAALMDERCIQLRPEQIERVDRCIASLGTATFSICGAIAKSICLEADSLETFLDQLLHQNLHI